VIAAEGVTARVFTSAGIQLDHPEGVAVHPDGNVWCGGEAGQVYRIAPNGSEVELVAQTGGFTLALAFGPDGALYHVDLVHRAVYRLDPETGHTSIFVSDEIDGHPLRLPNAVAFDANGALYLTDSYAESEPGPGVFRIGPDGHGVLWAAGPFSFANGIAVADDGSCVYVAETWARRVVRIGVEPDGSAGTPELHVELPGILPDGLAVGPAGLLYVACYQPSQVLRVSVDREVEVIVRDDDAMTLAHPTNIAFHGQTGFCANLGRWHITAIEGLAGDVTAHVRSAVAPVGGRLAWRRR
jgi:gluconolactonase